jgi:hypothetical protein
MNQTRPIPITNGTLVLDEEMLREAHIENKAKVIVQERKIVILPDEDVVEDTFGWIKIPTATARYVAESKELESDL